MCGACTPTNVIMNEDHSDTNLVENCLSHMHLWEIFYIFIAHYGWCIIRKHYFSQVYEKRQPLQILFGYGFYIHSNNLISIHMLGTIC